MYSVPLSVFGNGPSILTAAKSNGPPQGRDVASFAPCSSREFLYMKSTFVLRYTDDWSCGTSRSAVLSCRTSAVGCSVMLIRSTGSADGGMVATSPGYVAASRHLLARLEPTRLLCQKWTWIPGSQKRVFLGYIRGYQFLYQGFSLMSAVACICCYSAYGCRLVLGLITLCTYSPSPRLAALRSHLSWVRVALSWSLSCLFARFSVSRDQEMSHI